MAVTARNVMFVDFFKQRYDEASLLFLKGQTQLHVSVLCVRLYCTETCLQDVFNVEIYTLLHVHDYRTMAAKLVHAAMWMNALLHV